MGNQVIRHNKTLRKAITRYIRNVLFDNDFIVFKCCIVDDEYQLFIQHSSDTGKSVYKVHIENFTDYPSVMYAVKKKIMEIKLGMYAHDDINLYFNIFKDEAVWSYSHDDNFLINYKKEEKYDSVTSTKFYKKKNKRFF